MSNESINYRDDNGNIVSKEEHDRLNAQFEKDVEERYERIVREIVVQINNRCNTRERKIKMLFDYLTNNDMKFDLRGTTEGGRRATHPGYEFPPYKNWKVSQNTKYPAILYNSGVCESYSQTFQDICKKLGISCERVSGYTGMDHEWNVLMINNELKHIDIAYAIMNRGRRSKWDYFLKSFEELKQICGNRTMEENENEVIKKLTQIEINGRTDGVTPEIEIHHRTDTLTPKIEIHHRTDVDPNNKRGRR